MTFSITSLPKRLPHIFIFLLLCSSNMLGQNLREVLERGGISDPAVIKKIEREFGNDFKEIKKLDKVLHKYLLSASAIKTPKDSIKNARIIKQTKDEIRLWNDFKLLAIPQRTINQITKEVDYNGVKRLEVDYDLAKSILKNNKFQIFINRDRLLGAKRFQEFANDNNLKINDLRNKGIEDFSSFFRNADEAKNILGRSYQNIRDKASLVVITKDNLKILTELKRKHKINIRKFDDIIRYRDDLRNLLNSPSLSCNPQIGPSPTPTPIITPTPRPGSPPHIPLDICGFLESLPALEAVLNDECSGMSYLIHNNGFYSGYKESNSLKKDREHTKPYVSSDDDCIVCDEDKSIFSPAVYLLYLLDFVEESYSSINEISDLSNRFYQEVEFVSAKFNPQEEDSYIKYCNQILENFYTDDTLTIKRELIYENGKTEQNEAEDLAKVYQKFKNTPPIVPFPDIIEDLYDSYLDELGLSRQELEFIQLGNDSLLIRYAKRLKLESGQELSSIDTDSITYKSLWNLKTILEKRNRRKYGKIVKKELQNEMQLDEEVKFNQHFQDIRATAIEDYSRTIVQNRLPSTPNEEFEKLLNEAKIEAQQCIDRGIGPNCNNKVIYRIKELYKYYSEYLSVTPDAEFDNLENKIRSNHNLPATVSTQQIDEYVFDIISSDVQFNKELNSIIIKLVDSELNSNPDYQSAFDEEVTFRADENWNQIIKEKEKGFNKKIQRNLLEMIFHKYQGEKIFTNISYEEKVNRLSNYLFLDLNMKVDVANTPAAFLMSRLITMLQLTEIGLGWKNLDGKKLNSPNFDEEKYSWLKSYGTFHAAMEVTLFPENFIRPSLRTGETYHYKTYIEDNKDDIIYTEDGGENAYEEYESQVNNLNKLIPFGVVTNKNNTFFLAQSDEKIWYSVLGENDSWKSWHPISELNYTNKNFSRNPIKLIQSDDKKRLFLFTVEIEEKSNDYSLTPVFSVLKINGDTLNNEYAWGYPIGTSYELKWQADKDENGVKLEYSKRKSDIDNDVEEIGDNFSPYIELGNEHVYYENLIFPIKAKDNGSDEFEFVIGYSKPKRKAFKKTVIHPENTPYGEFHKFEYSYGDTKEEPLTENTFKSKWFEDNLEIKNDLTGYNLLWIKRGQKQGYKYLKSWTNDERPEIIYDENKYDLEELAFKNSGLDPKGITTDFTFWGINSKEGVLFATFNGELWTVKNAVLPSNINVSSWEKFGGYTPSRNLWYFKNPPYASEELYYKKGNQNNNGISIDTYREFRLTTKKLSNSGNSSNPSGPVSIYFDEAKLHIPLFIANEYLQNDQPSETEEWLRKILDIYAFGKIAEYSIDLKFFDINADRHVGVWLGDMFDPYKLANKEHKYYVLAIKQLYVESLLDRADNLFLEDNSESINRAREYYELAEHILTYPDTLFLNDCAIQTHDFYNKEGSREPELSKRIDKNRERPFMTGLTKDVEILYRKYTKRPIKKKHHAFFDLELRAKERKYHNIFSSSKMDYIGAKRDSSVKRNLLINDKVCGEEEQNAALDEAAGYPEVDVVESIILEVKPFCIPPNPLYKQLLFRARSNLEKIRTGRNFAGFKRELPFYVLPVEPLAILNDPKRSILKGGVGNLNNRIPPIYTYAFLLDRARMQVNNARNFQNSILNSTERLLDIEYQLFNAQQDLELERASLSLHSLKLREAQTAIGQSYIQADRATYQYEHYNDLIGEGLNKYEKAGLNLQRTASVLQTIAGNNSWNITNIFSVPFGGGGANEALNNYASAANTLASVKQTQASYQRREQEWKLARTMAAVDQRMATSGIQLANDRYNIVRQEREIGRLRYQFANNRLIYIVNQDRKGLYDWMKKTYTNLYKDQLRIATSTAKAAQNALEFERQTNFDFIGYGYMDQVKNDVHLGADLLLNDIERLDQKRLESDIRKNEMTKNISVANMAPLAFQEFKETGILQFETLKEWFDRDHPGHYMRLIQKVEVSIIGAISSSQGVHATLYNNGISRVMTGSPFEEESIIRKLPDKFTLSKALGEDGLLQLRPDNEKKLPFEGSGVATSWVLEMQKGANPINFDYIADVILTIHFTSLDDFAYRQKVVKNLGGDDFGVMPISSKRIFNIKYEAPDQWYAFKHPPINSSSTSIAYEMEIELGKDDFLPNEKNKTISNVSVAVQLTDEVENSYQQLIVPVELEFIPNNVGSPIKDSFDIEDIYHTSDEDDFYGKTPYGKWRITVNLPKNKIDLIQNILLIVDYNGRVFYNIGF